jgi:ABC-type bacteriocin/lantibiotic exporter with double-glycine peptidase domain
MRVPVLRRRVEYVAQLERAECGAACLLMVLSYHGQHRPLSELSTACGVSRDGTSARAIALAAQQYGLAVQAYRGGPETLAELSTPAILHWRPAHYVVLERVTKNGAVIVDPQAGRRRVDQAELRAMFQGTVLTFSPGPKFVRIPKASVKVLRTDVISSRAARYLLLLSATAALACLDLLFPTLGQVVIDRVLLCHHAGWLMPILGVLLATALGHTALLALRDRLGHRIFVDIELQTKLAFVQRLLHLPAGFFARRARGDLLDRVEQTSMLYEIPARALDAGLDGLLLIGYIGLLLSYDRSVGLCLCAVNLVRLIAIAALQRLSASAELAENQQMGREQAALLEALATPEVVKGLGIEEAVLRRYSERLAERLAGRARRRSLSQGLSQLQILADGVALAVVLWQGGTRLLHGELTLGVFTALVALQAFLLRPATTILDTVTGSLRVRGQLLRLAEVLTTPTEPSGTRDPEVLSGAVELHEVSFRYGTAAPWALQGISLHIAPGQTVAFVGPSGAGKSTLAALLLGLQVPQVGSLRFDGLPLCELELQKVRSQIGVVPQDPFLFEDTLLNNITLHDPAVSLEQVKEAARLACLDDVIAALPAGYKTPVGEGGCLLSAGQRQRLALARALVRKPRLLLLDEATSALDVKTEARVQRNLAEQSFTRIVIAHRLAAVRDADMIFVLQAGRVVQRGTFAGLLEQGGLFRALAKGDA